MFVTLFVLMVETNYVSRFAFWQGAQGCPAWVIVDASVIVWTQGLKQLRAGRGDAQNPPVALWLPLVDVCDVHRWAMEVWCGAGSWVT